MLKIALIELQHHTEVVRALSHALGAVHIQFSWLLSRPVYDDLKAIDEFRCVPHFIYEDISPIQKFLQDQYDHLAQCDAILCISESNNKGEWINFKWPVKSYLIIHDLNSTFDPLQHFKPNVQNTFKHYLRLIKYILLRKKDEIKKALACYDNYILPSEAIWNTAQSKSYFNKKFVGVIPINVHTRCCIASSLPKKELVISIPGTISFQRKNLKLLNEAISIIQPVLDQKVRIQFLGKLAGDAENIWLGTFSKLSNDYLSFYFPDKYLDQQSFDTLLAQSDFLIISIAATKSNLFAEQYGFTTVSGAIDDMIRTGIPALLPSFYPLPDKNLSKMTDTYKDSHELASKCLEWIKQKSYQNMDTSGCMECFSAGHVGKSVRQILFGI